MHDTEWSKRKSIILFWRKEREVKRQDRKLQRQNYENETSVSNVKTINKSSFQFINFS
jgi:hypothetical protein